MASESSLSPACRVPSVTSVNGTYPARAEYTAGVKFVPFVSFHRAWDFSFNPLLWQPFTHTGAQNRHVLLLILYKVQAAMINNLKTIQFLGGVINTADA